MGLVTLPFTLLANTLAKASEVMANYNAILAALNGGIQNVNLSANAGLTTDKYADRSVTGTKIALAGVIAGNLPDGGIPAIKLSDDSTPGLGANLSELFSESGGVNTNIIATRNQHGGKTVWFYVKPSLTAGVSIVVDAAASSIDWRRRLVMIHAFCGITASFPPGSLLPDGAQQNLLNAQDRNNLVVPPVASAFFNSGVFWSGAGSTGASLPSLGLTYNNPALSTTLRFYANVSTGNLSLLTETIGGGPTGIDFSGVVMCGPRL